MFKKIGTGSLRLLNRDRSTSNLSKCVADVHSFMRSHLKKRSVAQNPAFYTVDLAELRKRHDLWKQTLPQVQPFYAVKSNDDCQILEELFKLGCGFDCATPDEIQKVLSLGADVENIIYANPCKQLSHLIRAKQLGAPCSTFDSESELLKMKQYSPESDLLLRIAVDDSMAQCKMSMKYGAPQEEVEKLLYKATKLDMNVVGISFHVGSGNLNPKAFSDAMDLAHESFKIGAEVGHHFNILDIGGGFPGNSNEDDIFRAIANTISEKLDYLFAFDEPIRVMAEPGRFFSASCQHLAVGIIGKREIIDNDDGKSSFLYYLGDGIYGSFNCIMYDHAILEPKILKRYGGQLDLLSQEEKQSCVARFDNFEQYESTLFGPSCDGLDCVVADINLPELHVGDWLVFDNMGAYTQVSASRFNGFEYIERLYKR